MNVILGGAVSGWSAPNIFESLFAKNWKALSIFYPVFALTIKISQSYCYFNLSNFGLIRYNYCFKSKGLNKSLLLPNRILGIYFPHCTLNWSIQLSTSSRELSFVISNTTHAALESLKKLYTIVLYLYWPAVSQSSRLNV